MSKMIYRPIKFYHILALLISTLWALSLSNTAHANHRSGCLPEYVTYHFTPRTVDVNGEEKFVYKKITLELAHMPLPEGHETGCWAPSQLPRPNPLTTAKITVNDFEIEIPAACFAETIWPVTYVKITPYFELLYVTIRGLAAEDRAQKREIVLTLDPTNGGSQSFKNWNMPPVSCDIDNKEVWPKDSRIHG